MQAVVRVHPTLPVFRLDAGERTVFYAPGRIERVSRLEADSVGAAVVRDGPAGPAQRLAAAGRVAVAAWERLATKPFEPECLTVYLSNRCNLGCSYCFAAPVEPGQSAQRLRVVGGGDLDRTFPILDEAVVEAAARVVAGHCVRLGKPLTLVVHGGGEPTVHWELLQRVRGLVSRVAQEAGIPSWAYIATHGAISADRARWLARHFNLVGLSCDGPPEVQNANRPFGSGQPTARLVEGTAAVLREEGTPFTVRVTVTPGTAARQSEIVDYVHESLGARTVRIEPAYDGRRAGRDFFAPSDAESFVDGFLAAQLRAQKLGCDLKVSGLRVDEIHGPYCNPLRDVLHVTPDGVGTACFLSTGSEHPDDAALALGRFDKATGEFVVSYERAAHLRREAARIPTRCRSCVNIYHCARDCPDVCVITAAASEEQEPGFRCRVHQLLALRWLDDEETVDEQA